MWVQVWGQGLVQALGQTSRQVLGEMQGRAQVLVSDLAMAPW